MRAARGASGESGDVFSASPSSSSDGLLKTRSSSDLASGGDFIPASDKSAQQPATLVVRPASHSRLPQNSLGCDNQGRDQRRADTATAKRYIYFQEEAVHVEWRPSSRSQSIAMILSHSKIPAPPPRSRWPRSAASRKVRVADRLLHRQTASHQTSRLRLCYFSLVLDHCVAWRCLPLVSRSGEGITTSKARITDH